MAAKIIRLSHKIATQLHLVAEGCTICSSRARRPVRKLLDTPSYLPVRNWKLYSRLCREFGRNGRTETATTCNVGSCYCRRRSELFRSLFQLLANSDKGNWIDVALSPADEVSLNLKE